ncbi:LuxR family transcriptional regulator [Arthrobacter sp. NicSoilB8]|uniref:helix-turn-helix transcriptional regulator n=1 Tax=Arthrobacter sp. NicSoilB8 TaxID=2830998 RepID=UPI001CC360A0|nr:LuxR family transcriptional regulator [Arthrobacter sp. NicSoilB8]BCW72000.1 LuxR family transcriptional regulator [Arthrobacter sp. NicSoilB8]
MPDNDASPFLSGRTAQSQQLLGLLRSARSGVPALAIVCGRPGMGKTSLVELFLRQDEVSREATIVLRAAGAAWEKPFDFGLVQQLLSQRPVAPGSAAATASDGARTAGTEGDNGAARLRQVGDNLLSAVHELAGPDHTLVLWLDDLELGDIASLRTILYALRRIGPLRLLTILCVDQDAAAAHDVEPDDGFAGLLRLPGATTIRLGPLTADDILSMWRDSPGPGLTAPAARALVEHTGGSPALVRPLLEQFSTAVWSGSPEHLPAPADYVVSVASALKRMSPEGAALTEAAAVLGVRSQLALAVELAGVTDPVAGVDSANAAGLLRLTMANAETRLEFPLPVVRAAVYQHLGPGRRVALHTAAAAIMTDPLQRLSHRAAAALLPDATLAAELESSAEYFASNGAWHRAAEAYAQASRLNPELPERELLLVKAVDAMVGAGELPRAEAALEALDSFAPSPRSDAVRGYLAILRGRPAQADALLHKAWTAVDPSTDAATAGGICQRQVLHALARFHGRDLVTWAGRARRLASAGSPPAVEAQAIEGLGLGAIGRYDEAEMSYRAADQWPERAAQHQRIDMGRGWLHLAMDRVEEARAELAGAVPTEFAQGSQRISLWAQGWLARADFTLGAWDEALRTVENAVAMQEESGIDLLRPLLHWSGAQIHALRGNWDAAAHHLDRGAAATDSYPTMLLPYCLAQAQVAETKADYDGVIRALLPVVRMQRGGGIDEPGFWPWQDHYANALVMVGRVAEADAFLVPHEELAARRGHRSTLARLSYVRGRIQAAAGDLDAARATFQGGLAQLDTLPMPFARARVKFAYGQSFRRAGKRKEAAATLAEARELFAVLGAEAYVDRCSRELRASGVSTTGSASQASSGGPTAGGGPDDLTEQEKSVAALVASGLSNREAAAELYISVKTVQYHLTRIYAKLRVTSRSGLAAAYPGKVAEPAEGSGQSLPQ